VCVVAMAAADFGGRSRLQVPPCFQSLLLSFSSLLTQHPRRSACSCSVSVFSLGKGRGSIAYSWSVLPWERERGPVVCNWPPIWGRGKVTFLLSLHLYPLLNERGVFGCWISLVPIPLLSYPRLVPIPILPYDRPI